jgi:hypothetical protein
VSTQLRQIAVVVEDAFAAARAAEERFRIGPFVDATWEPPALHSAHLHGQEAAFTMDAAVAALGSLELEFISPRAGRSMYSEYLEASGAGAQHLLVVPPSPRGALAAFAADDRSPWMGGKIATGTEAGDVEFCYLDTVEELGTAVELCFLPEGMESASAYPPTHSAPLIEEVTHVGLVVPDADAAAQEWTDLLSVANWTPVDSTSARILAAELGSIKLELAQPQEDGIYAQLAALRGGTAVAYVGVGWSSAASELAARSGSRLLGKDGRREFVDAVRTLGFALMVTAF